MKRVMVKSVFDTFEYVMQHYYPAVLEEFLCKICDASDCEVDDIIDFILDTEVESDKYTGEER